MVYILPAAAGILYVLFLVRIIGACKGGENDSKSYSILIMMTSLPVVFAAIESYCLIRLNENPTGAIMNNIPVFIGVIAANCIAVSVKMNSWLKSAKKEGKTSLETVSSVFALGMLCDFLTIAGFLCCVLMIKG